METQSYRQFATIYDNLINEDIDYRSWSEKIKSIASSLEIKLDNYLDLACGTGNITQLIAPDFKETWGVDLSENMLMEADEKLRDMKIKARFVSQDMRELNLNKKFNLITCCLDSINYITELEDVKLCFSAVNNHLNESGVFIFDINSHYKLTTVLGNNTFTHTGEDIAYIWENYCEDEIVEMYLTFFIKSGDFYERFEEEHIECAYTEIQIEEALRESGLVVVMKLDNYMNSNIKEDCERITYVVKKYF